MLDCCDTTISLLVCEVGILVLDSICLLMNQKVTEMFYAVRKVKSNIWKTDF